MEHKFINQIQPGEGIDNIYTVKDPILRSTSRGDLYIAMYLCDKTGQVNGRMWQATEAVYTALPKPGFVRVQGRSELYQNNLQVIINNISVVDPAKVEISNFLAATDKDVDKMFDEVKQMLSKIKNPQVSAIIGEFLNDKPLMENFRKAPAAMKLHHSYLGGLLEHTHNMLRTALAILPFYPQVQADLLLAGLFLHDLGKTDELAYDMAFSYTDSGQLIGHIAKTMVMLHKKADKLAAEGTAIDEKVLDSLGHIIL
ncbi:MAG: 3'-5' exoribonuclease YhaM family protein, partial [Planctomycetota bacterium]